MSTKNLDVVSKKKLLLDAVSRIDKQYGKGSVMFMSKEQVNEFDIPSISTGSLLLDRAIGIGGVPCGRVIEVYGPEASGKTTIALQIIAEAQKKGGIAAFVDAEHALDISYAQNLGIKVDELLLSQPDYGEQALDIVEMLVRSGAVDVIVVDSVAALVPKSELEGDMGDTHVGLQARLMSQALRKLTPLVHKSNTCLIFINQVRQNINSMPFAPKETTTGGNALKFYASLRLDVRRIESIKDKEGKHIGNKINIKIVKNKVSIPFKVVTSHLMFGYGVSKYCEILDIALLKGIIEQSGSWFSYKGDKICQGKEGLITKLKKEKKFYDILYEEIIKVFSDETKFSLDEEENINEKNENSEELIDKVVL
jgi:recombination protein RecA